MWQRDLPSRADVHRAPTARSIICSSRLLVLRFGQQPTAAFGADDSLIDAIILIADHCPPPPYAVGSSKLFPSDGRSARFGPVHLRKMPLTLISPTSLANSSVLISW
jgi:hypothetical protein